MEENSERSQFGPLDYTDEEFGQLARHILNVLGLPLDKVIDLTKEDLYQAIENRIRETERLGDFAYFNYLYYTCQDFYDRLVLDRETSGFKAGFAVRGEVGAKVREFESYFTSVVGKDNVFYRLPASSGKIDGFVATKIRRLVGYFADGDIYVYGEHPDQEYSIVLDKENGVWRFSDDQGHYPYIKADRNGFALLFPDSQDAIRLDYHSKAFEIDRGEELDVDEQGKDIYVSLRPKDQREDSARFGFLTSFDQIDSGWPLDYTAQDIYGLGMVAIGLGFDERLAVLVCFMYMMADFLKKCDLLSSDQFLFVALGPERFKKEVLAGLPKPSSATK